MGTKNSVSSINKMRNGLDVKSLGDKPYKHPEYANNFFKGGGLIPGSTNTWPKHTVEIRTGAVVLNPNMTALNKTDVRIFYLFPEYCLEECSLE
jgi:hypothetical protein